MFKFFASNHMLSPVSGKTRFTFVESSLLYTGCVRFRKFVHALIFYHLFIFPVFSFCQLVFLVEISMLQNLSNMFNVSLYSNNNPALNSANIYLSLIAR